MNKTKQCVQAGFHPAVTPPSNTKRLQAWWHTGGGPAGEDLRPHPRQSSQALIEFALISPVLLLLLFGIVLAANQHMTVQGSG